MIPVTPLFKPLSEWQMYVAQAPLSFAVPTPPPRPTLAQPAQQQPHRCFWVNDDAAMIAYHDREWGVPVHDDRRLFEMLSLEAFQTGLSWITVLKKRDAFRRAFDEFDFYKV